MGKRLTIGTFLTAVALILLLSFKTPEAALTTTTAPVQGSTTKSTYSGQLTGSAIQIPYGVVQVQVTLQGGKITDIQAIQMPGGGHSSQVSQYAEPQLRSEVLAAQSTQVDSISGATYTSYGYLQSVQSALDQAGTGLGGGTVAQAVPAAVGSSGTTSTSGSASGTVNSGGTTSGGSTTKSSYTGVVIGQVVQIPFGTIQVKVTFSGGKITDIATLSLPQGGRSGQLAQYAAPQLRSEVLAAQSTQVDSISGATYTSQGYLQSVQSALDQAGV
jgi:uncharacterized protein with FMN-binding domain